MSALPTKPFWMVYGLDQHPPRVMHRTRAAGAAEMQRLARANPGVAFVLLESVGAAVKQDLQTIIFGRRGADTLDVEPTDEEIPF